MKNILVPIGSTENAANTLQYAVDFASEINAKVFVFRAYKAQSKAGTMVDVDKIISRETNLYLRAIIKNVDTKNIDVKLISAKGSVIESINAVNKKLKIDLIIVGQKSNSTKKDVFLGSTTGSIVKKTEIPTLIVPIDYQFKPFKNVLTAFKSGVINKPSVLEPLQKIKDIFNVTIDLLLVKTPGHTEEDLILGKPLLEMKSSLTITENATTYQGVLEHFQAHHPDLLCVFRRHRGFFMKLWEKNTIKKSEFFCKIPLLVLSGKK